ncbi:MAG: TatD family hydrolase [Akkermansia sp.]
MPSGFRSIRPVRRETYVQHALREGIDRMITLGRGWMTGKQTRRGRASFPARFCALGIHPDDAYDAPADWADQLFRKAQDVPLAAIGETGLDYFHGRPKAGKRNNSTAFSRNF